MSCCMKKFDLEAEKMMRHNVLVLSPISVQPHCVLSHKPSCKDQTRFKNTLKTTNLLFQWLKKAISADQPENICGIYENHEKSFLSTHTFFLQSPNNNASIHFYVIYWHSSLSWQTASLP